MRIYKANKGIYGAPRIHKILSIEGFNVSLKRVQRKMNELRLCAVTVKNISLIQIKSYRRLGKRLKKEILLLLLLTKNG